MDAAIGTKQPMDAAIRTKHPKQKVDTALLIRNDGIE
ncbi:hypothetical protein FHS16_001084 [Paenibacillus endophyticus]|uniref:Uncharacterized protein n=1 Tax=Paenibacillus endophyticus TaxID=1294268 RepID=A0A7W5C5A1_9BACL|nr:hypothetical protein [Paenibacillus endophyticus]